MIHTKEYSEKLLIEIDNKVNNTDAYKQFKKELYKNI
ncbi:Uncharacterised protein [Staphylococcus nepalensis]|nr:Uncharacterised protein [Staphylococcus nepalensis]SUM94292.1 Uncharacterised protein [Staphylococcus nepalensis]